MLCMVDLMETEVLRVVRALDINHEVGVRVGKTRRVFDRL